MHDGQLSGAEFHGGFDLQATLESGQTYLWERADGEMFTDGGATGGTHWYHTVLPSTETHTAHTEWLSCRWDGSTLEWRATTEHAPEHLRRLLRLDDDLRAIGRMAPSDGVVERAFERFAGMRLVRDPSFGSLVSFICSAQMRVERIHAMVSRLATTYGDSITVDGESHHAFPRPAQLAEASEAELRELSIGYRAPYVKATAEMVADGTAHPDEARTMGYESARSHLCQFMGVGNKVADCVLLFALGFLQAVPLDTWIQTAIADHYPACERDDYEETSAAIRAQFGGEYAGYVQTYVFNHLRTAA